MIGALVLALVAGNTFSTQTVELTNLRKCLAPFMVPDPVTGVIDGSDNRRMLLTCFPYASTERVSGVWITGFETSYFIDGATALPKDWRVEKAQAKLAVSPRRIRQVFDLAHGTRRVFQVTFFGRRPITKGWFGRDNPVVVEQFIMIRRLR